MPFILRSISPARLGVIPNQLKKRKSSQLSIAIEWGNLTSFADNKVVFKLFFDILKRKLLLSVPKINHALYELCR
jgi:hypothetical protein